MHYSKKLKNRLQISKYKKCKITNSANESGEIYPSGFSMDLVDLQLRDALPSTLFIAATADKGTHYKDAPLPGAIAGHR